MWCPPHCSGAAAAKSAYCLISDTRCSCFTVDTVLGAGLVHQLSASCASSVAGTFQGSIKVYTFLHALSGRLRIWFAQAAVADELKKVLPVLLQLLS